MKRISIKVTRIKGKDKCYAEVTMYDNKNRYLTNSHYPKDVTQRSMTWNRLRKAIIQDYDYKLKRSIADYFWFDSGFNKVLTVSENLYEKNEFVQ